MKVSDAFDHDAAIIGPFESLTLAAERMREKRVGFLVVLEPGFDNHLMPVGVLTDRDLVNAVIARESDSRSLHVMDAMTRMPLMCGPDEDLLKVARRMRKRDVRRAPVVGGSGEIIGVLTLDAVLDAMMGELLHSATRRVSTDQPIEGPAA